MYLELTHNCFGCKFDSSFFVFSSQPRAFNFTFEMQMSFSDEDALEINKASVFQSTHGVFMDYYFFIGLLYCKCVLLTTPLPLLY